MHEDWTPLYSGSALPLSVRARQMKQFELQVGRFLALKRREPARVRGDVLLIGRITKVDLPVLEISVEWLNGCADLLFRVDENLELAVIARNLETVDGEATRVHHFLTPPVYELIAVSTMAKVGGMNG